MQDLDLRSSSAISCQITEPVCVSGQSKLHRVSSLAPVGASYRKCASMTLLWGHTHSQSRGRRQWRVRCVCFIVLLLARKILERLRPARTPLTKGGGPSALHSCHLSGGVRGPWLSGCRTPCWSACTAPWEAMIVANLQCVCRILSDARGRLSLRDLRDMHGTTQRTRPSTHPTPQFAPTSLAHLTSPR
jgi:hypothetical protein